MKKILFALPLLITLFTNGQVLPGMGGPLIITQSGHYTLNNTGDANTRAVEVYGSASEVWIDGGIVNAVDDNNGLHIDGNVKVHVDKLKVTHSWSGTKNVQSGIGIFLYQPRKAIITHCEVYDQYAIKLQDYDRFQRDSIIIAYNTGAGVTKVKQDGVSEGNNHCHFIHLDGLQGYTKIEVYGNRYIGKINESDEDIFNFSNTWTNDGTTANVFSNCFGGAYKWPITSTYGYSGSGCTFEEESRNFRFYNNIVFDCENALVNNSIKNANNRNIWMYNNFLISAGIPRGAEQLRPQQYFAGWSWYLVDGTTDTTGINHRVFNNWEAYGQNRNLQHYFPVPGRQDENNVTTNSQPNGTRMVTQNIVPAGLNYPLSYTPTVATMDSAIKRWDDSMYAAKSYAGITAPNFVPIPSTGGRSIIVTGSGVSVTVRDSLNGKTIIIASDSSVTLFRTGSMYYSSDAPTTVKVLENPSDETAFTLKALKAGKANITVAAYNLDGVLLKKTFVVEVLNPIKPATGFSITLQPI